MIVALLALVRPANALIAGLAVVFGLHLGGGEAGWLVFLCGALSAILITAFANIDNDISDKSIDCINRPDRPLPSGRVTLHTAFIFSLVVLLIGLLAARVCGKTALVVAGSIAVWLVIYNRWAKRRLLIGNVMVAIAGGMPLVYAGIISDPAPERWKFLWLAFALAAAFHLARELLKDIQDVEGDRIAGAKTVPIALGIRTAARLSGIYLLLIAFLSLTPAILRWLSVVYLYGVATLIVIPSAIACFRLWQRSTPQEAGKWSTMTKTMMVVGIILLWLGA
jgi:4-hydroxybenzoate polyprenyltransferase